MLSCANMQTQACVYANVWVEVQWHRGRRHLHDESDEPVFFFYMMKAMNLFFLVHLYDESHEPRFFYIYMTKAMNLVFFVRLHDESHEPIFSFTFT